MLFSRMGWFDRGTKKKYFFYILKLRYSNKNLAEVAIPHFDNKDLYCRNKLVMKAGFREKFLQLILIYFKIYFCNKIKRKVSLTENVNKCLLFFHINILIEYKYCGKYKQKVFIFYIKA